MTNDQSPSNDFYMNDMDRLFAKIDALHADVQHIKAQIDVQTKASEAAGSFFESMVSGTVPGEPATDEDRAPDANFSDYRESEDGQSFDVLDNQTNGWRPATSLEGAWLRQKAVRDAATRRNPRRTRRR